MLALVTILFAAPYTPDAAPFSLGGGPDWTAETPPADEFVPYQRVQAMHVEQGIEVDGLATDPSWTGCEPSEVALSKGQVVSVCVAYTDAEVFFLLRWKDDSPSRTHQPWVWSAEQKRYVAGSELEDSIALRFSIGCDFVSRFDRGLTFDADYWYWGAARTDGVGYAGDGEFNVMTSKNSRRGKRPRSYAHTSRSNEPLWYAHQGWPGSQFPMYRLVQPFPRTYANLYPDFGTYVYSEAAAPEQFAGDTVPRWVSTVPEGNAADIRARGTWSDGVWTVEFSRARQVGKARWGDWDGAGPVTMAIGVLDGTEFPNESVSETLFLLLDDEAAKVSQRE
jgi:hypothetical protein